MKKDLGSFLETSAMLNKACTSNFRKREICIFQCYYLVALMKIGIVLSTNDPEEVWNTFRFGNVVLKENHAVRVFLVNKGVEAEDIKSDKFPVKEQLNSFLENKGEILACGTCMKARMKEKK